MELNWSYLERLSTFELKDLAEHFNIALPDGLERIFIIDDLLEYAPCLTLYRNGRELRQSENSMFKEDEGQGFEPADLPQQYNITYVEAIIRDPLWVYVFWEIRTADRRHFEKLGDFNGYFLQVSVAKCPKGAPRSALFSVQVNGGDSEYYLNFPPEGPCRKMCAINAEAAFKIELYASVRERKVILAESFPFMLPKMLNNPGNYEAELQDNGLLRLSGIDELPVIRNGERLSPLPYTDCACSINE
jgi:hypothetical protein